MSKHINFPQHLSLQVLTPPSSKDHNSNPSKQQNTIYFPKRFQTWYQEHQATLYPQGVIWKMTCYKHPEKTWYFLWNGFVSPSSSSSDFFEDQITMSSYLIQHNYTLRHNSVTNQEQIPFTPVNTSNISLLSSGDRIVIEPVSYSEVAIVKDLLLQPLSSFDFDILSTMGEYVEQNLLRSLNPIVFPEQLISIPVRNNQSLQANLRVKELALLHNSLSSGNKSAGIIARMNAQTSLIIEPFQEDGKKLPTMKTSQENVFRGMDDIPKPLYTSEDLLQANITKVCVGMKLRVSPQHLSVMDTSFSSASSKTTAAVVNTNSGNSSGSNHNQLSLAEALAGDEILDALFTDMSASIEANPVTTAASSSSRKIRTSFSKACTAFLHPSVVRNLLERSLQLQPGQVKLEDVHSYLQQGDGEWMIRIQKSAGSSSSDLLDHYTLGLELAETVRQEHVVLPTHVRKALVLWDYEEVDFIIFPASSSNDNGAVRKVVMPRKVSLRPVLYSLSADVATEGGSHLPSWRSKTFQSLYETNHSSVSGKEKHRAKTPQFSTEMVTAAFLRFVEQHTTEDTAFCLTQDTVIHLTFSPSLVEEECEDVEVDFIADLVYSEAASKDKQQFRYVPLTLFTEAQSQVLSYVLQHLEVAADQAVRVTWSETDLHLMAQMLDHHPYGYADSARRAASSSTASSRSLLHHHTLLANHQVFAQAVSLLAIQLHPTLARQRWQLLSSAMHPFSSPSFLVTGKTGTGKTYMLQTLMKHFHHHPLYCTSSIYLDGQELRDMPLQTSIKVLHEVFSSVSTNSSQGPVILMLDDLDLLCPSHRGKSSANIVDEKSILLATYLIKCFAQLRQRQVEIENTLRIPIADQANVDEAWLMTKLVARQVICIASAHSLEAVDSLLFQPQDEFAAPFSKCLSLPSRIEGEDDRLGFLQTLLSTHHIPMHETLTTLARKDLCSNLEKFCMTDFQQLVQHVYLQVRKRSQQEQRIANAANNNDSILTFASLQTKLVDIRKAMQTYVCLQDQQQDSTSTTSSFRVPPASDGSVAMAWKTHVAGYQQVQSAIYEVLYYPILFQRLYAQSPVRLPRAIMLYGPPGCGKTFLAKTVGYELFTTKQCSHFYYIKGPQLLNKYIGASEKMIRDLFQQALQHAHDEGSSQGHRNVLIFFDEFEALAPRRGKDNTGITDRIVNQLLTFIDGVESSLGGGFLLQDEDSSDDSDSEWTPSRNAKTTKKKYQAQPQIYIMVGSTRPDLIDPALLRPGRIEKHIYVGLPSSSAEIFDLLKRFLPVTIAQIDDCVNSALREVSRSAKAKSMTVADLKAVMDTAYLLAAHERIDSYPTLAYDEYGSNQVQQPTTSTAADNQETVVPEKYLQPVVLQGDHILKAFQDTRPSMSPEDMQSYENAYTSFRKPSNTPSSSTASTEENTASPSSHSVLRTPSKTTAPSLGSEEGEDISELQTQEKLLQQRYDRIQSQRQVFH